ncbi:MAG TPA: hypothetical protein VLT51_05750 [Anaerolineales bacterium]|nr:hypothetical protein [Anaerolineales bacterium]
MSKTKILAGTLLIAAILFAQVGTVFAAPQAQDGTITGTIDSIETGTDADGNPVVLVTLTDDMDVTQTLQFSLEDAIAYELVTVDPDTGIVTVDASLVGTPGEFDPARAVVVEEPAEPEVHIISTLLADFFFDGDLEMASLIDSFHNGDNEEEQVYGFGVIAQALWMATIENEDGTTSTDAELAGMILDAKKSGDYGEVYAALGGDPEQAPPTNWGQFKKDFSEKKHNLGSAVSNKTDETEDDENLQPLSENGKGNNKGRGSDRNRGKKK